jgi:hypothetical protein
MAGGSFFRPSRDFGGEARARWNCRTPVVVAVVWTVPQSGQNEGVHNVHTLGFGSGRASAGLARTGDVFGGVAVLQRLECSSSPTSGTCFPCSGACEPLGVHKLFTYRCPFGAFLVAVTVAGYLLPEVRRAASGLITLHGFRGPPRHKRCGFGARCPVVRATWLGRHIHSLPVCWMTT